MSLPPDAPSPEALPEDSAGAPTPAEAVPAGDFFVVGMGASAGGLEALTEILKRLPVRTDLAIIVVQHLDPHHESMLVDLLNRVTGLPVEWAANGRAVTAGLVLVAPPHSCLSLRDGVVVLENPGTTKAAGAVDFFLQALAEGYTHRAIAVILSGNGADGSHGCKAVKGHGGIVFAQDPATAGSPSMPSSAIATGSVDHVLAPAAIAEELVKLTKRVPALWERIEPPEEPKAGGPEAGYLATIYRLLLLRTGVDFSDYKQSTIKRRIVRQMMLAKLPDLADYVKLLQKNREEVERLYESLLINVTEFFRDREYFEFLQDHVYPELIDKQPANRPIRLWVAGVATGEEAYSLAILLREVMEARSRALPVQIFGTDVSERAISAARAGHFSPTDVANIDPERLKRYFVKTDQGFMVQKHIRDMCVFARQNVLKDSPFSHIDLISCRNLLIYFNQKLQRKLMPVLHYALNPNGWLVLGSSESIGGYSDLYRLVDRRFRIYVRKSTGQRTSFGFAVDHPTPGAASRPEPIPAMSDDFKEPYDVIREADRVILNRHGPTGVLVNEDLEILQFRGDVSPYLAPVAGRASLNLLKMAREGLALELQATMQEAREKSRRVQRTGVTVLQGDSARIIDLDVTPLETALTKDRYYLVLFSPATAMTPAEGADARSGEKAPLQPVQVEQLRQELQATRSFLQSTIEKHEATNQELRAANEEIQSSNEELQSTNEELETAKEELQSTNEELTTVNEELHSRHLELIQLNNDLTNLINSVHLPIIILGPDMRIRRFTPMAEKVLNVIPTDIGRPMTDLNMKLNIDNLPELMSEVVESLTIKELEVQDRRGRWYSMRLRPYKTADQKIEGVVVTLIDVDEMKRTITALEDARDFARAIIESVPAPLAVLDQTLNVSNANEAFARLFRTTPDHATNRSLFDLVPDRPEMKELRTALEGILPTGSSLTERPVSFDLPGVGSMRVLLSARRIVSGTRSYPLILLSVRPP